MSPVLREVREQIHGLNLKTDRRLRGFEKLVEKITNHLGHDPTDADLQRLGRTGLMNLATNGAERDVAGKIARRFE